MLFYKRSSDPPKSFNEEAISFQALRKSVNVTLEKHAPTKKRYPRSNQPPI